MAPGCSNVSTKSVYPDTVDSFEVLEQTVMKQKRMNKKKKTDLRMRILLKRTFDLVCEIMDHENGFGSDPKAGDQNTTNVYDEKIKIESIPLPIDKKPENDFSSVVGAQVEEKEYHTLTNVVFDVFENRPVDLENCATENSKAKRKHSSDSNSYNYMSNKRLKMIDINSIDTSTVHRNES
jgi:hypothetical protein